MTAENMYHNRDVIRQFGWVSLCELGCTGVMLGVYALLGRFTLRVLLGGLLGAGLSVLNFLLLSMAVSRAADRAESEASAQATMSVRGSAAGRMLLILAVLVLAFKAGICEPLPALLPLLFLQLCVNLVGFFRRDSNKTDKDGEILK